MWSDDGNTTETLGYECLVEVRNGDGKTRETVGYKCLVEVRSVDGETTVTVQMPDSTADHHRWNGCRVIEVAAFKWLQLLPRGIAAFD